MASVIEMQEERARVLEQMKALASKAERLGRDFKPQEARDWAQYERRIDDLAVQIEEAKRAERTRGLGSVTPGRSTADADLGSFLRGDGRTSIEVNIADTAETRDLLAGSGTGANVVPTSFRRQLMEHLIAVSAIRQTNVTVLSTASGERLNVPKTTTHPTASLVAEGALISESDPVFATVPLDAFKYANLIQLSSEFVQDEAVDVVGYLARAMGRALGNASVPTSSREREQDSLEAFRQPPQPAPRVVQERLRA
jgi:HK97 family phage major capsid protein